tara:strand:- start:1094 stop:1837 length:744 start_codon:yes stop_codon:yes gene_type:complete
LKELNRDKILDNLPLDKVNIDIFDEIDSTNDEAKRITLEKDFHIIIAEKQTKGRGRLGKKWSSPNSGNIYMTICTENDLSKLPISLITGLICKKAINKISNKSIIMLKWPNDILLNNKKIGGILVETEVYNKKIRTIIGIGINIKIKKEESWWGDLSKFSIEAKRDELINQILSDFIEKFDKLDFNWMDEWKNSCIHMNKKIKINDGNAFEKEAIFLDVDKNGNAIVKTDQGRELISSGEISIKGVY